MAAAVSVGCVCVRGRGGGVEIRACVFCTLHGRKSAAVFGFRIYIHRAQLPVLRSSVNVRVLVSVKSERQRAESREGSQTISTKQIIWKSTLALLDL